MLFSLFSRPTASLILRCGALICSTALVAGCATQTSSADPQGAAAQNAATTPDTLAQTSWQLTHWQAADYGKPAYPTQNSMGRALQLDFLASGSTYFVSGFSGCNQFRGGYTMERGKLAITAPASTRMACPNPADGTLERDFLKALTTASSFSLDSAGAPRQLTLTLPSGDTLGFTRGPDPDKPKTK